MEHGVFLAVDLQSWVHGTIDKVRRGESWGQAWTGTYVGFGGRSRSNGTKGCPMAAARTLYEYGRIREGGMPFVECDLGICGRVPGTGRTRSWRSVCCVNNQC